MFQSGCFYVTCIGAPVPLGFVMYRVMCIFQVGSRTSVAIFVLWTEGLAFLPVYPTLPLFSLMYQLGYQDLSAMGVVSI